MVSAALVSAAALAALALAPSASAATCDGVSTKCSIGDTGPGGGVVFYDAGSTKSWGRYLEAAPVTWAGGKQDPEQVWCPKSSPAFDKYLNTGTGIGTGKRNSARIVGACGAGTAAGMARAYQGGGKADWYLPSKREMELLRAQQMSSGSRKEVPSAWTSSQYREKGKDTANVAWATSLRVGSSAAGGGAGKQSAISVIPIRAF